MPVILVGGGGHGGVVLEVCRAAGVAVVGVIDDDAGCAVGRASDGVAWLGRTDDFVLPAGTGLLLGVGCLAARGRLLERLGARIGAGRFAPAVAHPSAVVSRGARLGDGAVVMPGAVVNRGAGVGAHAIINTRAVVEHDCVVGANAHLAPGSVLGGGATVGGGTLVGIHACVLPGVRVGDGCVVGAGAVVVSSVADGDRVAGVPARVLARR